MTLSREIAISTWFTLDDSSSATGFPSAGSKSSERSFQDLYWRCVGVYFLTARLHNPDAPLILFCNEDVGDVAPAAIRELLGSLAVTPIRLDLSHRLPKGSVSQWGNVFYELDIVKWFARHDRLEGLVITDSDCVWRSAFRPFEQDLWDKQCLIYTLRSLDQKNYENGGLINGMSLQRMQEVLYQVFDKSPSTPIKHNGGEFIAVTKAFCARNLANVDALWEHALSTAWEADSVKTEEHFWNIIAKLNDVPEYSANSIVRRMWTNFNDVNLMAEDLSLPLWHLPAEKRFGFRRMWNWYASRDRGWQDITPSALNAVLEEVMGVPRRGLKKMVLDITEKVSERLSPS